MAESIRSQGTGLYFAAGSPLAVMKLTCPTSITGINSGAKDQIDDTCLDELTDRSLFPGLATPGAMSVPFVFKPSEADQQELFDLKNSSKKIEWLIALSNGTLDSNGEFEAPTLDSNGDLIPPASRTSISFIAYVSEVTIDVAANDVVRGTLTLQRSGPTKMNWKS